MKVMKALLALINKKIMFWLGCRVFLGKAPRRVTGPAIIFWPLRDGFFCCGFAGIVTLKKPLPMQEQDGYVSRLGGLLETIKERCMKPILEGSLRPDGYLHPSSLETLEELVRFMKTDASFGALFFDREQRKLLANIAGEMGAFLLAEEQELEEKAGLFTTTDMEIINGRLVTLRDVVWALEQDILANLTAVEGLAGNSGSAELTTPALKKYKKINFLLNCIDRLEVRGRDSAGLHVALSLPGLSEGDMTDSLKRLGLDAEFHERNSGRDLINGSISFAASASSGASAGPASFLAFTYKTSSVVGELGRNGLNLRRAVAGDAILRQAARRDALFDTAFVHTRWASVGAITDENCHPVNNYISRGGGNNSGPAPVADYPFYGAGPWTITAALNGDIDNYHELRREIESDGGVISPSVTTDTKIIPLIIEKYLKEGENLTAAFQRALCRFEGSHAIVMMSNVEPGKVFLALRGSGQALYVGIAPDQYVFASEIYGLVEITPYFIKMDGETPRIADVPETAGQIFVLDQESPGGLSGISAFCYDGSPLTLAKGQIRKAEITTRDVHRGAYAHYFLKEISESSQSVKKTLRGKYLIDGGKRGRQVRFNLGEDVLPLRLRESLKGGSIGRIIVIGHGTAAVAGEAVAAAMEKYLSGCSLRIEAKIASELSGFCLGHNLNDTLVIAITQSGTTTDTNRAVSMALERGAKVLAIVNRRQSDITTKVHGVFYTSDGRDIEMSVASTKAFYSQIVAGHILALFLAQLLNTCSDELIASELASLEKAPEMMARVLAKKEEIGRTVSMLAGRKKYWAVVGSGPNKAAADEIRIKLSELCYRTISSDVVENKKHIDLSAEPLIIVCAAGSPDGVTDDIVKDVAIFKAHNSGVIVFADEGERRFSRVADAVIEIPSAPVPISVILNTMAGHIWGYFAACMIDHDAVFLRDFRGRLSQATAERGRRNATSYEIIADRHFRKLIDDFSSLFTLRRREGAFSFTGVLTISNMVLLLKYCSGKLPLEDFWQEFPGGNGLTSPLDLLDLCLAQAIDELSRPIDAIRHQAKTVTVGTSRKEPPPEGVIFTILRELGFSSKALTGKNLYALMALQPAIAGINGYTLYDINNLNDDGNPGEAATISIGKRGGVSLGMKSRVETSGLLMGTKRTIVSSRHIYVGCGKADAASIIIIPLLDEGVVKNLLLLHVDFDETLAIREKINVMGYRYNDIRNLVNEYNLPWEDHCLDGIPLAVLLGEPAESIAEKIIEELKKR